MMLLLYEILLAATVCDYLWYKIPNRLIYIGIVAGYLYKLIMYSPGEALYSLLSGISVTLGLSVLYIVRALGAGDIKLLGLVGVFVGFSGTVKICLISLIVGAFAGFVILIYFGFIQKNHSKKSHYIRFSIPILISVFIFEFV